MELTTSEEFIYELPREIPINELLGRKLYIDLKKAFKFIEVQEPEFWNTYTIEYPKNISISMGSLPPIKGFSYRNNCIERKLYLAISEDISPLDIRTIWQHINREITKCLKRNKKKLKQ